MIRVTRKVVLLTSTDLVGNDIGAIFIRDMIATVPEIEIVTVRELPFLFGPRQGIFSRFAGLWRRAMVRSGLLQSLRLRLFRLLLLSVRTDKVAALVEDADCLWLTASSPEIIYIGERLAERNYDVRVMVLDAPGYLAENLHLPPAERERLNASFDRLLQRATHTAVISHALKGDYTRRRHGRSSEIIRHGIDLDHPIIVAKDHGEIRIVFAGTLYAKEEWNAFVSALMSAGWQIAGRPVTLTFMGSFPLGGAVRPRQIRLAGKLPFDEALKVMASMDIGYLPYWFNERYAAAARTSFPSKLSAYAAAGLSVFHHGPAYTEVTNFLRQYAFGVACDTLQPAGILAALEKLVDIMDTAECATARDFAFRRELSRAAMAGRMRAFLSPAGNLN